MLTEARISFGRRKTIGIFWQPFFLYPHQQMKKVWHQAISVGIYHISQVFGIFVQNLPGFQNLADLSPTGPASRNRVTSAFSNFFNSYTKSFNKKVRKKGKPLC